MDRHPGVLEERVQALPVGRETAGREGQEGPAHDRDQGEHHERQVEEEHRGRGERVLHPHHHQAERAGDERPQQERALLPAPQPGQDVAQLHRARPVGRNVLVAEVVREEQPPERRNGRGQRQPLHAIGDARRLERRLAPEGAGQESEAREEGGEKRHPVEELAQVQDAIFPFSAAAWYLDGHLTRSCSASKWSVR